MQKILLNISLGIILLKISSYLWIKDIPTYLVDIILNYAVGAFWGHALITALKKLDKK